MSRRSRRRKKPRKAAVRESHTPVIERESAEPTPCAFDVTPYVLEPPGNLSSLPAEEAVLAHAADLARHKHLSEAVALLQSTASPSMRHKYDLARYLVDAGRYAEARAISDELCAVTSPPECLFLTAKIRAAGRSWFSLRGSEACETRDLLARASKYDRCPEDVYSVLASSFADTFSAEDLTGLLATWLSVYDKSVSTRLAIARECKPHGIPVRVRGLLDPILEIGLASKAQLWLTADYYLMYDDVERASMLGRLVERLSPECSFELGCFLAECLARSGDVAAALAEFKRLESAAEGAPIRQFAVALGQSACLIATGNAGAACFAVGAALEAWKRTDESPHLRHELKFSDTCSSLGRDIWGLSEVIEFFYDGDGAKFIRGANRGRLAWLVAYYDTAAAESRYTSSWAPRLSAVLNEALTLGSPAGHEEIVAEYYDQHGDYESAVRFALAASERRVSRYHLKEGESQPPEWVYMMTTIDLPSADAISVEKTRAAIRGFLSFNRTRDRGNQSGLQVARVWYRDSLRSLLLHHKLHDALQDVATALSEEAPNDADLSFDIGYAQHMRDALTEAEQSYRRTIELHDSSSAHHNLGLILERQGRVEEAVAELERAFALTGDEPMYGKWIKRLREQLEESREQNEFVRTAPDRWPQVESPGRNVLAALVQVNEFNFDHLAKLTGMTRDWAERHYKKLVRLGMVVEDEEGNWQINPHIKHLIERERSHAVATQIIRADDSVLYKPIFNSKAEYEIYQILIALFPNQLVFPNMALMAVFQYERMREILDRITFEYFMKAQVDFCITHAGTYYPIIAFELDSDWHDSAKQIERDDKKNRIFKLGGVPLLRLRKFGKPTTEAIRIDIINAVANCDQLRATDEKLASRLGDVDLDRFLALSRSSVVTAPTGPGQASVGKKHAAITLAEADDDLQF